MIYTTTALEAFPAAADSASITPSGSAWSASAAATILASAPANLALGGIVITAPIGSVEFEIEIYSGATLVARRGGAALSATSQTLWIGIPIDLIVAGDAVTAVLRKSGTDTTAWRVAILAYRTPLAGQPISATAPALMFPAAATGAALTGNGTAWTNSGWVLVHTTASNFFRLDAVVVSPPAVEDTDFIIDIATAENDGAVIASVRGVVATFLGASGGACYALPVHPMRTVGIAGTTLYARIRKSGTGTDTWRVKVCGGYYGAAADDVTSAGRALMSHNSSGGVSVQQGQGGVFGAWVEIATLPNRSAIIGVAYHPTAQATDITFEIGVGTVGSEQTIWTMSAAAQGTSGPSAVGFLPTLIRYLQPIVEAGTRISLRAVGGVDHSQAYSLVYRETLDCPRIEFAADPATPILDASGLEPTSNASAWANSNYGAGYTVPSAIYLMDSWYATPAAGDFEFDLAFGVVSSESVRSVLRLAGGTNPGAQQLLPLPFLVPASSRLSARVRRSVATTAAAIPFAPALVLYEADPDVESYVLKINDVEKSQVTLQSGFRLSMPASGIWTLEFDVESEDASYRPRIDDVVEFMEEGVAIFKGVITSAQEAAFGGPALTDIVTRCVASSNEIFASYRYITETIPAGTLKAALEIIAPYFSTHGIALDPSQVDGPTLTELNFTRVRGDEVLNRLAEISGYIWQFGPDDLLRMFAPGSHAAPGNLLATGDVHQVGDVTIEPTRDDTYANTIILIVTGAGPATSTEEFGPSDYTTDGTYRYFTVKYPASTNIGEAWPNELLFNGVNQGPVGRVVTDPQAWDVPSNAWDWDMTTEPARLRYRIASGAAFPTTETISVTYAIGYPFEVTVQDLGSPPEPIREVVITQPEAMTMEEAIAFAESLLGRKSTGLRIARWDSHTRGWRPGQTLTVNLPKRDVNATFLIQEVILQPQSGGPVLTDDGDRLMRHSITAIEGVVNQGNWRDTPKSWLGGGVTISGGVSSTGAVGVVPAAGLEDTGVTPGTYGDSTNIPVFTVDAKGRITAASEVASSGGGSGADYVPMGDGGEPMTILSDGAGGPLLTPYTP